MLDNEIMNMDAHGLIEIVLCVNKAGQRVQIYLNNHKYRTNVNNVHLHK